MTIVAGCGIHNDGGEKSEHDGIHSFHIAKNAKVLYIEKHYGEGAGTGERILNPTTEVEIAEGRVYGHGDGADRRRGFHLPHDARKAPAIARRL